MKKEDYLKQENLYIGKDTVKYADGSEDYFIKLFEDMDPDLSEFNEKLKLMGSWANFYHLSNLRGNVIRPFFDLLDKESRVLELGAGMGAITSVLAKQFKQVDSIEGSLLRARALGNRVKKQDNVDIYVGNLLTEDFGEDEYDLATLIGVLEYIPLYGEDTTDEFIVDFLSKVTKSLKENGVLVLAIENKFGMKYLSGCKEDHNGEHYSGVMGYPFKSPITYGRKQLEKILGQAGFNNIQFYHPFPDYKLPKSVIRECEDVYNLNPDIFPRENYTDLAYGTRKQNFIEPLVYEEFSKEGIVFNHTNSFIVLCSKDKEVNLNTDWIYEKINNSDEMKDKYHHTVKIMEENKELIVKREKIQKDSDLDNKLDFSLMDSDKYIKGNSYMLAAYKAALKKDDYTELKDMVLKMIQTMLDSRIESLNEERFVEGRYLDYTFWNIIEQDGELKYIDQKWSLKEQIPVDYVIYRSLSCLYKNISGFVKEENEDEFLEKIFSGIINFYSYDRLELYRSLERKSISNIISFNSPEIAIKEKNRREESSKGLTIRGEREKLFKYISGNIKGDSIYIWAAGQHTENLLDLLKEHSFNLDNVKGIINGGPSGPRELKSIPVMNIEQFLADVNHNCTDIIISSASFEDEILKTIESLKISNKINIIPIYRNHRSIIKVLVY